MCVLCLCMLYFFIEVTKMALILRKASAEDYKAIGHIIYTAWRETYKGLINDTFLNSMTEEMFSESARKRGTNTTIMCFDGDKAVGVCVYIKARDKDLAASCGEVQAIYILDEYKNMGLGRKLIEAAENELRALGFTAVSLWVLKGNNNATGFYKRMGYAFDGKEQSYNYVTPVTELRMTKLL